MNPLPGTELSCRIWMLTLGVVLLSKSLTKAYSPFQSRSRSFLVNGDRENKFVIIGSTLRLECPIVLQYEYEHVYWNVTFVYSSMRGTEDVEASQSPVWIPLLSYGGFERATTVYPSIKNRYRRLEDLVDRFDIVDITAAETGKYMCRGSFSLTNPSVHENVVESEHVSVFVVNPGEYLALGRYAMLENLDTSNPNSAVDGRGYGFYQSDIYPQDDTCTRLVSRGNTLSWWAVDLSSQFYVDVVGITVKFIDVFADAVNVSIVVTNREPEEFKAFSYQPDELCDSEWHIILTTATTTKSFFCNPPMYGRYVVVIGGYISMCEVLVKGSTELAATTPSGTTTATTTIAIAVSAAVCVIVIALVAGAAVVIRKKRRVKKEGLRVAPPIQPVAVAFSPSSCPPPPPIPPTVNSKATDRVGIQPSEEEEAIEEIIYGGYEDVIYGGGDEIYDALHDVQADKNNPGDSKISNKSRALPPTPEER